MYTRYLDTDTLKALNRDAIKRGYNRTLSDDAIRNLDPNGIHVVAFSMLHETAKGKPIVPHVRSMLYMKYLGMEKPIEAYLDIPLEDFYKLEKVNSDAVSEVL